MASVYSGLPLSTMEWMPFPSPGDLPNTGIKAGSLTSQADSFFFFNFLFLIAVELQYYTGFRCTAVSQYFTDYTLPNVIIQYLSETI